MTRPRGLARPQRRLAASLRRPGRAWTALAALLLLGALAVAAFGWRHDAGLPQALAWRRDAPLDAWRLWGAAFVHFDARHLAFNAAGTLLLGALGAAAALPARAALAWALAWPLTQAALWLAAEPAVYAGLSGVLHAGAAVAAVFTVTQGRGAQRLLGAVLGLALLAKLLREQAWVEPLRTQAGWDFPLAVVAHASGALCGTLAAAALLASQPAAAARGR
ncbi:rhombosortase [Caldimonas tepidiphila]|uniref:rhombosortase n=1 Tax=Caldimonas tepidiphila TaxID=2315841 RepID=UPI0013005C75|nr:rhombosortase [Caldimonas tepidiphila]